MPMVFSAPSTHAFDLSADRLGPPVLDEHEVVRRLLDEGAGSHAPWLDWSAVKLKATPWIDAVRRHPPAFWAMESLLQEYPLSSAEGLALMRLAEALLRVPDTATALALTADQLGHANFSGSHASGPHPVLAPLADQAIAWSKRLLTLDGGPPPGLLQRLGAQTVVAATMRAIELLGRQFVLGETIESALRRGHGGLPSGTVLHSYDMLGEGARTDADALHYLAAYRHAVEAIRASLPGGRAERPEAADGLSIKLSALDPRFEAAHQERVAQRLLPRLLELVDLAAPARLNLTLDAEESDRLELSLHVLDAVMQHVTRHHPGWTGLGLAVQAYQLRAPRTVETVIALARRHHVRLMVRLVKGAYWDGEIKRAQELGLSGYPVFTEKDHTDLCYLHCARHLLAAPDAVYPQFASHNAGTIAAIALMARHLNAPHEMQRLHGMGEGIYAEVMKAPDAPPLRIYAPVGRHRDLLAYLVRRLLENGANSSFVHQLADPGVGLDHLLHSPLTPSRTLNLPLPDALYGPTRRNAAGLDLTVAEHRRPLLRALQEHRPASVAQVSVPAAQAAMVRLQHAQPTWAATPLGTRCEVLRRTARLIERDLPRWTALLVHEGGKTLADAIAEVREAVDFCRYYAEQAERLLVPQALPGPTGESNTLRLHGRGVFVCISPWNFPLAIFAGQVAAALVTGNTVAAKPAEQTPACAQAFVETLYAAGLPRDAMTLLPGLGETVGAALVAHPHCAGVCFTGSTAVARAIARTLADRDGPIVPLIAETGGLNAMIVDSSALPEQVVDAVVSSAFRSAGQRCSALRLLCLHDQIAGDVLTMLGGAMQELRLGRRADADKSWAVDVGPVIDAQAHAGLSRHLARLDQEARLLARTPLPPELAGTHIAPVAYQLKRVGDLKEEVFGPVLHVVRWGGDVDILVDEINALGYGLTLGVHTRIDERAQRIAARARVGNVYVNRNMIGAVVGVQPFGGEGLSGTGPKAGGPHYLLRFCAEQTLTLNTAAAGGNAALLAGR